MEAQWDHCCAVLLLSLRSNDHHHLLHNNCHGLEELEQRIKKKGKYLFSLDWMAEQQVEPGREDEARRDVEESRSHIHRETRWSWRRSSGSSISQMTCNYGDSVGKWTKNKLPGELRKQILNPLLQRSALGPEMHLICSLKALARSPKKEQTSVAVPVPGMKYNLVDVEIGFELLSNYSSFRDPRKRVEETKKKAVVLFLMILSGAPS